MSESRFIDPGIWDQNVTAGLRPDPTGALFAGIDASIKHDSTALVCVKYDRHTDNLLLADQRIWVPSPGSPMDFEATLEFYIRRLDNWQTRIEKILVDPFQMHRTITMLQRAGLPIEPFPQSQPNLTLATETLYSALTNRRLRLYDAPDLRAQVLNAASVENEPGFQAREGKAKSQDRWRRGFVVCPGCRRTVRAAARSRRA